MTGLNLKLKTSLRSVIQAEEQTSGASKKDPRYLNYFDMTEGQRMEVLFLPCASGSGSWVTDHVHGPRARVGGQRLKGVAPLSCSRMMLGEKCVVCDEMFDHYTAGDKPSGNILQVSERATAQVLVLKSDIEVQYPDDGNIIKLFNLPQAVIGKLKQSIMEEQVDQDELYLTPFVIKVTKNGEYNQYDTSFFARKNITSEEFEELIEGKTVSQYDFTGDDFLAPPVTIEEQEVWLDDVKTKIAAVSGVAPRRTPSTPATPSRSAMAEGPQDEEFDEDVPSSVDTPAVSNKIDSLRDRLKK